MFITQNIFTKCFKMNPSFYLFYKFVKSSSVEFYYNL